MLDSEIQRRRVHVQDAGIRDQPDACLLRRIDDGHMLRQPASQFIRGNQQQLVHVTERRRQCFRAVVVGQPNIDAALLQIYRLLRAAHRRDEWGVGLQPLQRGDREAAQLAGGSWLAEGADGGGHGKP